MTCPHANVETRREWEEIWSNGMFGIPASNMPIATDLVNETFTCTDCGEQLLLIDNRYVAKSTIR